MVFRNFRLQVIVRVLLLAASLAILLWCLLDAQYLRAVYAGIAVVIILVEFFWYVDRFNRDIDTYLVSLMQRDFTTRFPSRGRSRTFDELYETLNKIAELFKTISAEKEAQFRFLEMLVEHIRVGIISVDETGKITLANQAAKDLLQKDVLFSLKSLQSFDATLVGILSGIRSNETRLYRLRIQNQVLQLSIHASEFKMEDKNYKLISMQNIQSELDAREMEAWQKLIRVLTHEIMNSVSPITSLSETMHSLVDQNRESLGKNNALFETLDKGLDAIRLRSEGLFNFTQSYRKLTGVPQVLLKSTNTRDLIDRVTVLMENKLREKGITLKSVAHDAYTVNVDPGLMEHVLINLVNNAMDAVSYTTDPIITIGSTRNGRGEVLLFVRDNGEGIDETTAEKIFIPFFTTRKHGSGIGLALVKQILQLHHADITFESVKGKGTEFAIRL